MNQHFSFSSKECRSFWRKEDPAYKEESERVENFGSQNSPESLYVIIFSVGSGGDGGGEGLLDVFKTKL